EDNSGNSARGYVPFIQESMHALATPFLPADPQVGRQVLVAKIRKYRNYASVTQGARELQCRDHGSPRRLAHQDSLELAKAIDHSVGVVGIDLNFVVQLTLTINARHDRAGHMFETLEPVHRIVRLNCDYPHIEIA